MREVVGVDLSFLRGTTRHRFSQRRCRKWILFSLGWESETQDRTTRAGPGRLVALGDPVRTKVSRLPRPTEKSRFLA